MSKKDIGKTVGKGVSAFTIIMESKLVSIGFLLFTGVMHIIDPSGGLNVTAKLLAGFVALYAILSFFYVISNNNSNLEKGKDFASNFVRGVIEDNKDPIAQGQELNSKYEEINELQRESNTKWDKRINALFEKPKEEPKAGKIARCILYAILFVSAVILFFCSDITIVAIHIIVGIFLITDGYSSVSTIITAKRNGVPMKGKRISLVANIFSIVLGIAFILMARSMAEITMVIGGITLLIKGLTDLFVMIQNREILTSAKGTINQIKQQGNEESSDELLNSNEKTE